MTTKFKPIIIRTWLGEIYKLIPIEWKLYEKIKTTEEELNGWLKLFPNQAKPKIIRISKDDDKAPSPF